MIDDGIQLSVVVLPLLLLRRRGLSHHLLVDFPALQILLHFQDIDKAPNGRITAAHETPKLIRHDLVKGGGGGGGGGGGSGL